VQRDDASGSEWAAWAFANTLDEGVCVLNEQGLCTFANAAALAILGFERAADIHASHLPNASHAGDSDSPPDPSTSSPSPRAGSDSRPMRFDDGLLRRQDGTAIAARQSICRRPDGAAGCVVTFSPLVNAGEGWRTVADRCDGDKRRRAEEELRDSEARYRALADNISQLAWMTGPDGAIDWYNKRWYDFTGTTLAEMQGWGWKKVHHPDHVDRVVERIAVCFEAGTPWEDTFPLRGKDGHYRWFLSRAEPIHGTPDDADPRGRLLGWFGTNTDITELREAEQAAAVARQEAEQANQAKSAFIANMSHELRTPLSAIIGYSEMLQEEMAEGALPDELTPDMRKIESNARHLLGLINDVLDLSKVESGKMEVYAEEFDVEPTLRDMVATVEALVAKKGNRLNLRLEPSLGAMRTDVTKLRQILLNLLSNAAKFTEGGTITLAAMRIPGGEGGDWLAFRVTDTGIGMTEEQLGRLFQRFAQADSSTTRKFGGTGLGLSISKAFAVMLGGDLSVDSQPGEGTTFTAFLPADVGQPAEEAEGALGSMPHAPTEAGSGRDVVLVIDDDPAQRDLMTRFLGREGFGAVTAADGYSGLQLAKSFHPRAILLDVTMPGLDGWSVLSALKADPAVADIPVVMVTFVDERGLATSLGAADYVMKPVRWEQFRTVMDRYRDGDGTVLLVDDDPDTRRHIRTVLERDDWAVVEAEQGAAALDQVADAVPRVVLLDLEMPVMDGFDFLRAFRALPGCASVPVVVLTAKDLTRDDRRRLQGANEVLSKGMTSLADLSRELRRVTMDATGRA
jgi:PAS domain S-box-containing protein